MRGSRERNGRGREEGGDRDSHQVQGGRRLGFRFLWDLEKREEHLMERGGVRGKRHARFRSNGDKDDEQVGQQVIKQGIFVFLIVKSLDYIPGNIKKVHIATDTVSFCLLRTSLLVLPVEKMGVFPNQMHYYLVSDKETGQDHHHLFDWVKRLWPLLVYFNYSNPLKANVFWRCMLFSHIY